MSVAGGVVLAGGRSSRMGSAKAALEWHGSTLLWRTVRVIGRGANGPLVVVRSRGQDLPALPPGTEVVDDPRAGLGPVQAIAAGLAALASRVDVAFVASTDLPFLHPAFVCRVLQAAAQGADVGLPVARGFRQPLAASYRTSLAPLADRLARSGLLKPAYLLDACAVTILDEQTLLADPALATLDPGLDSVVNINEPLDYEAARARPGPAITVQRPADGVRQGITCDQPRTWQIRAATVAEAAAAIGLAAGGGVTAVLKGELTITDRQMPLVAGDVVEFRA
jgi:molybdopterin-guanine dinucleotide biosynthesis protein A